MNFQQACALSRTLASQPDNSYNRSEGNTSETGTEEDAEDADGVTSLKYNQKEFADTDISEAIVEENQCVQKCDHKYEVGVVVDNISTQYLHVVGPIGDTWLETCVDPLHTLVLLDGVRTREVYSVKTGTMGHMVLSECVKCQFKDETEVAIAVPCMLWFGDEQKPSVRGAVGEVVGKDGDRMVVQLEGPPAARNVRLVLFYLQSIVHRELILQTKVLVWAWNRQQQQQNIIDKRGVTKFLEGAAVKRLQYDVI